MQGLQIEMIWLSKTSPQGRWCIYIWVLGISLLLLASPMLKGDAMKQYRGRHISIRCQNGWANYLGSSDVIYQADGIGLILQ